MFGNNVVPTLQNSSNQTETITVLEGRCLVLNPVSVLSSPFGVFLPAILGGEKTDWQKSQRLGYFSGWLPAQFVHRTKCLFYDISTTY